MKKKTQTQEMLSVCSIISVFVVFLARIKRTDLGKAKTVVGTCPDMCPEKERYMRETRNQLSIFELVLGTDKVFQDISMLDGHWSCQCFLVDYRDNSGAKIL